MNILDAQLYYSCINKNKNLALVVCCDVKSPQTLIRTFNLDAGAPELQKQEVVPFPIKFIDSHKDKWLYVRSEEETHHLIKSNWDTLRAEEETLIDGKLFAHNMVISPDEALLAITTFKKDKTINIFDANHMTIAGSGKAEYSPYVQGLNFSPSSNSLGFVNFDQGGGHATCLRKSGKQFAAVYELSGKQFKDDVNMNATITFDGDDMIVTVVEMGQHFHIVRYDKNGEEVWSNKFTSVISIDLSEEKIRPDAYFERIWNQQHKAVMHQGNLYVGANAKIHVIDVTTGVITKTLAAPVKGFAHQLHLIPSNESIFVLDCLGNTSLVSLQADGLDGEQWYQ